MIAVVTAADAVIERSYNQQRLADALGEAESDAMRVTNRSEFGQFVDDLCATPPKVELLPRPNVRLNADGLHPADVIVVAARFRTAADHLDDDSLEMGVVGHYKSAVRNWPCDSPAQPLSFDA